MLSVVAHLVRIAGVMKYLTRPRTPINTNIQIATWDRLKAREVCRLITASHRPVHLFAIIQRLAVWTNVMEKDSNMKTAVAKNATYITISFTTWMTNHILNAAVHLMLIVGVTKLNIRCIKVSIIRSKVVEL